MATAEKPSPSSNKIYHEKQRLQYCLLHSLNNLFQQDTFTKESLNQIADKLVLDDPTPASASASASALLPPLSLLFKPHHNTITGNYDVNVLISALQAKSKSVQWHDRRKPASSIRLDDHSMLMGIMLNLPVRRYAGLWRTRHWITLRNIRGLWYNLDSDLASPLPFQDTDHVKAFLDSAIANGGEVFLVINDQQQ